MGTRAVIKYENEPMLATHWDGYPKSLGVELVKLKNKTPQKVIEVASAHNIDQIAPHFAPNKPVIGKSKIYYKDKLITAKKFTKFLPSAKIPEDAGTSFTKGKIDYKIAEVVSMKKYGDFAEWEYNIKGDKVYARKLDDSYDKAKPTSQWVSLYSPEKAEKFENDITAIEEKESAKREVEEAKKDPEYGAAQIYRSIGSSWMSTADKFGHVDLYKETLSDYDKKRIYNYLKVPKVRTLINKGRGWHYETLRHKLASYGIKTNLVKGNMSKLNAMYRTAKI